MNRTNLKLLADWLIENDGRLIETKTFDMGLFRGHWEEYSGSNNGCSLSLDRPFEDGSYCGTVGCAIGWAPFSKIPELSPVKGDYCDDYWSAEGTLDFNVYCDRVMEIDHDEPTWDYLFDEDWGRYDNTPQGAAIRILYVLGKGFPEESEDGLIESFESACDINQDQVDHYTKWYLESK